MDLQPIMDLIIQTGSWCLAAFFLFKLFMDYINKDKEEDRKDQREEKERVYSIMDRQNTILEQQKDMINQSIQLSNQQIMMAEHNKEMLSGLQVTIDKMTDIQILHANRLERIEDKQNRMEEEIKKIGSK